MCIFFFFADWRLAIICWIELEGRISAEVKFANNWFAACSGFSDSETLSRKFSLFARVWSGKTRSSYTIILCMMMQAFIMYSISSLYHCLQASTSILNLAWRIPKARSMSFRIASTNFENSISASFPGSLK